eukprot:GHVP01040743.1.p1 GENE.GHVP01040743.1~~GHVP01040743.1.p1  ORF type:complete len:235 (+),score=41.01 GHVP01040743.1:2-706(+)
MNQNNMHPKCLKIIKNTYEKNLPQNTANINFPIQPYLSLQLIDDFTSCGGYLLGATNSVIPGLISPDVLIDLRRDCTKKITYSSPSIELLLSRTDNEKKGIGKLLKNALWSPTPTDNATQFFLDLFQKKHKNHKFVDSSAVLDTDDSENSETNKDGYVSKPKQFFLEVAGLVFSEHLETFLCEIKRRIESTRDLSLLGNMASEVAQATGWSKKFTKKFCEGNLCSIWAQKILQL